MAMTRLLPNQYLLERLPVDYLGWLLWVVGAVGFAWCGACLLAEVLHSAVGMLGCVCCWLHALLVLGWYLLMSFCCLGQLPALCSVVLAGCVCCCVMQHCGFWQTTLWGMLCRLLFMCSAVHVARSTGHALLCCGMQPTNPKPPYAADVHA
jgi:hypothetical protein